VTNQGNVLDQSVHERAAIRSFALALEAAEEEIERQCLNVFQSVVLGITGERTEHLGTQGRDILADRAREARVNAWVESMPSPTSARGSVGKMTHLQPSRNRLQPMFGYSRHRLKRASGSARGRRRATVR